MKLLSLPCYCATLRQAARAITVLYEDMLADSGLRATQYTALQLLDSAPNLTTTELAEALGIDQTTATPLGSQCPGASATEETETPLGRRAGSVREAPGTSGSHGSEKSIVPRREQTLPGLNPFMPYNA